MVILIIYILDIYSIFSCIYNMVILDICIMLYHQIFKKPVIIS